MHHTPTGRTWLAATALIILGTARAADAPQQTTVAKALRPKVLDLKPPDIRRLYTPEQIKQLLSATVDPDLEGVEVEGSREKLINENLPLWRSIPSWLSPKSSEDAEKTHGKPSATSTYRPPAAAPPPMAGEERRYDR